jgi:hypothetical protein
MSLTTSTIARSRTCQKQKASQTDSGQPGKSRETSHNPKPPRNGASVSKPYKRGSRASRTPADSTSRPSKKSSAKPGSDLSSSRFAIQRLAEITELLRCGRPVNCTAIADRFEVSTKTAQRDMEFLRDRLGVPAEYDPQAHTWRLEESSPVVAFLQLASPGQVSARRQAAMWRAAA